MAIEIMTNLHKSYVDRLGFDLFTLEFKSDNKYEVQPKLIPGGVKGKQELFWVKSANTGR